MQFQPEKTHPGPDYEAVSRFFVLMAMGCGLGVMILGLFGVADGLTRLFIDQSLARTKPMAVSSGLILILVGGSLALSAKPGQKRWLPLAAALVTMVQGLVNAAQGLAGGEWFLDFLDLDSLARLLQSRWGLPHSPMSPFTGVALAAMGFALILQVWGRAGWMRGAVGLTGAGVFAAGLIFFLGYLYGTPLLYNTGQIPISRATTLGMMVVGAGLGFAAGPRAMPFRSLLGQSIYSRLMRTFPPLMAGLFLIHPFVERIFIPDPATGRNVLANASFAVMFAGFTALLVIAVGRGLAKSLERAESARQAAEAELEKSRKLVKAILDAIPQAVVGVNQAGAVTHFNHAAANLAGKDYQQVKGLPLGEVFPQLAPGMRALEDTLAGRLVRHLPRTALGGGLDRLWDIDLYPLEANGSSGAVIRLDDVTDRVRLEEMMIQSEKMMSVGQVAAGMAHEVNNPLGGIAQSAQVVLRRLSMDNQANLEAAKAAGCTLEAVRDFLARRDILAMIHGMREAAVRAAHIVTDMLEFSRKSESTMAAVDLRKVMDKAVELCRNDYDLKKNFDFRRIEIKRDYQPDMPDVTCSANQMEQVFVNLLRNAAQAMVDRPQDSPPPRISLSAQAEQGVARLEVADNGPGISPEARRRIFEPFYTTKSPGVGTGLGLSVSYFIVVANHGGNLEVQSKPGQGARFIIRLPLAAG